MSTRDQLGLPVGQITVAELAAYSGRAVREIIDYAFGESGRGDDAVVSSDVSKSPPARVETRTAAGRYAYDQAVFGVLEAHGRPMTAYEIRDGVGGTPEQVRASLARLLEDDIVVARGQGLATCYELV